MCIRDRFITPYMIRNVGFAQGDIVYIYMIGGIATVFSAPFTGKMIDKFNARSVYFILVFAAMIPVLLLTHLPAVSLAPALIVTTLFFILGGSRFIPSSTAVTGAIPPKIRGSFMSFNSSAQQLGTASASLAAGYIIFADGDGPIHGYGTTGIVATAISLLSLLVLSRLKLFKAPEVSLEKENKSLPT